MSDVVEDGAAGRERVAGETDLSERLRMRRPFASAEERTYLELQHTAGLLLQSFTHLLREHAPGPRGITPSQYNVLRILRGAHSGGLTCGEIAERLVTPAPDVTRLLDRLEERGYLERGRDRGDRRIVRSHLSARGLETVEALDGPVRTWLQSTLGHVQASAHTRLWQRLQQARSALDEA